LTWTVRLHAHTIPEERVREVEDYYYQATLKDPTFKFTVEGENGKVKNIIIECESKDQAFKRGCLFHHRFGCYYEVEKKK